MTAIHPTFDLRTGTTPALGNVHTNSRLCLLFCFSIKSQFGTDWRTETDRT